MERIKKSDRIMIFLVIILSIGTIITLKLARDNYHLNNIQSQYVKKVVDEVKVVANYDVDDFEKSIRKINMLYPLEIELKENDSILYSTLSIFNYKDNEIEKLNFLANATITNESGRELNLGVYDGLDYNVYFKNLSYIISIYLFMFFLIVTTILIYWSKTRKELQKVVLSDNEVNIEKSIFSKVIDKMSVPLNNERLESDKMVSEVKPTDDLSSNTFDEENEIGVEAQAEVAETTHDELSIEVSEDELINSPEIIDDYAQSKEELIDEMFESVSSKIISSEDLNEINSEEIIETDSIEQVEHNVEVSDQMLTDSNTNDGIKVEENLDKDVEITEISKGVFDEVDTVLTFIEELDDIILEKYIEIDIEDNLESEVEINEIVNEASQTLEDNSDIEEADIEAVEVDSAPVTEVEDPIRRVMQIEVVSSFEEEDVKAEVIEDEPEVTNTFTGFASKYNFIGNDSND